MDSPTCRICCLPLDCADDVDPSEHLNVGDDVPLETLHFKLMSLGFLEVGEEEEESACRICCHCAPRVEDAFDLKVQCLKASRDIANKTSTASTAWAFMDSARSDLEPSEMISFEPENLSSSASKDLPALIKLASKGSPISSSVSIMSASARDMFACVQNLSSSLKFNVSLLTNAIYFMENTLSLLTVLISLKEQSPAIEKSARAIREEAELWKMKSAMIGDASDYIKEVSCSNLLFGMSSKSQDKIHAVQEVPISPSKSSTVCSNNSKPPSHQLILTPKSKVYPNSPPKTCSGQKSSNQKNDSDCLDAESFQQHPSAEGGRSVRRSFRSRSVVDHLVYWPSFRKNGSGNNKTVKSSKKNSDSSGSLGESLDCLLLKREVSSEFDNSSINPEQEKWAVVRKRKVSDDTEKSKWKIRIKLGSASSASNSSSDSFSSENGSTISANDDTSKDVTPEVKEEEVHVQTESSSRTCPICNKTLCSNRNLQAHIRMHTGASPYQCTYCYKTFSSGWNRAQHERVHTGEKPYVCDLCEESFRYNVTLRHHKLKVH